MIYGGVAESLGCIILINTNSERIIKLLVNVKQRAIPDFAFTELCNSMSIQKNIDCRLCIEEIDGYEGDIISDENFTNILVKFSNEQFVENDVEIFLLSIFAHFYTKKDMICSYGIGLSNQDNSGILVIGEWGSGKSIVAMSLLRNGFKFIGNDRTVIKDSEKGVLMVTGSLPIRLRIGTVAKYFPDLLPSFIPKTSPWGSFLSYQPSELNINQIENIQINNLFRVKITPIPDEYCTCHPATDIEGRFTPVRIYHSLSYYSLDFNLLHLGMGKFYPRFDTEEKANIRMNLARKIILQAQTFEIYGNLKWVTERILNIVGGGV